MAIVSTTEDEEDMPYDMYSNDIENKRMVEDEEGSQEREEHGEKEGKGEGEEVLVPESDQMQDSIVTDLVRTCVIILSL